MELTPQAAAAALAEIARARAAMRRAIREHRGHWHLWIWGAAWIAMPAMAQVLGDNAVRFFPWICVVGAVLSFAVGVTQGRQIKLPFSGRFLGMLGAVLLFAAIFPFVLHARPDSKEIYAYVCLVAMQGYVIAGLWTDTYVLWLGLFVTALILVGSFFLPGMFWLWMAVCGGGSLVLTGFYVRHCWR
jgi:hypothetical protein